ncbi:hypothetical protein NMY22_g8292 [Coprinellus aureogranulatus]|nr:hypothetical protein NMY22_g8292 [Coprinellus aureogranulatus]
MYVNALSDDISPKFAWPFMVINPHGIKIRDVINFVHANFQEYVREREYYSWTATRRKEAARARILRCSPREHPWKWQEGELDTEDDIRRIDYLGEKTLFRGLAPNPDGTGGLPPRHGSPSPTATKPFAPAGSPGLTDSIALAIRPPYIWADLSYMKATPHAAYRYQLPDSQTHHSSRPSTMASILTASISTISLPPAFNPCEETYRLFAPLKLTLKQRIRIRYEAFAKKTKERVAFLRLVVKPTPYTLDEIRRETTTRRSPEVNSTIRSRKSRTQDKDYATASSGLSQSTIPDYTLSLPLASGTSWKDSTTDGLGNLLWTHRDEMAYRENSERSAQETLLPGDANLGDWRCGVRCLDQCACDQRMDD